MTSVSVICLWSSGAPPPVGSNQPDSVVLPFWRASPDPVNSTFMLVAVVRPQSAAKSLPGDAAGCPGARRKTPVARRAALNPVVESGQDGIDSANSPRHSPNCDGVGVVGRIRLAGRIAFSPAGLGEDASRRNVLRRDIDGNASMCSGPWQKSKPRMYTHACSDSLNGDAGTRLSASAIFARLRKRYSLSSRAGAPGGCSGAATTLILMRPAWKAPPCLLRSPSSRSFVECGDLREGVAGPELRPAGPSARVAVQIAASRWMERSSTAASASTLPVLSRASIARKHANHSMTELPDWLSE